MTKKAAKSKLPINSHPALPKLDFNIIILLALSIGIIPLLLRSKLIYYISPKIVHPILNTGAQTNLFTYYKWVFLIIAAIIATILFLIKIIKGRYEIRSSYINVPVLIFSLLVIISSMFAQYKAVALYGTYDRWEGAISQLCYLALFFIGANLLIRKDYAKYINYALALVVGVNLMVAMLKFWGVDILKSSFVQVLLLPSSMRNASMSGSIGSTLENPNYTSGLFGALLAYFVILSLASDNLKQKIFYIILSVSSLAILLSSRSSSGFVSMLLVLLVAIPVLLYITPDKLKVLKTLGITLVCCSVIFFAAYVRLPSVYNDTFGTVGDIFAYMTGSDQTPKSSPQTDSTKPAVVGTDVSSGRFFIWSRTLDMVWDKPLLGHGAGTLAYYFPQNDPEKFKYLHNWQLFINKSHNEYLELAFSYGLLAIIALLALFIIHIGRTLLFIVRDKNLADDLRLWRLALLAFFGAYVLQWLFNDTTIGSAVIFWVLFGLAVSLNNSELPAANK